jgi:hypothetical protein
MQFPMATVKKNALYVLLLTIKICYYNMFTLEQKIFIV